MVRYVDRAVEVPVLAPFYHLRTVETEVEPTAPPLGGGFEPPSPHIGFSPISEVFFLYRPTLFLRRGFDPACCWGVFPPLE